MLPRALALLPALTLAAAWSASPALPQTQRPGLHIALTSSLRRDAALDRVAEEQAVAVAEIADPPRQAELIAHLKFLMDQQGIRDAVFRGSVLVLEAGASPQQRLPLLLENLAHGEGFSHCGVGIARRGERDVISAVVVRRQVELAAPRILPGRAAQLCGTLRAGRQPRVFVTLPTGQVLQRKAHVTGARFCAPLPVAPPGRHQVEVMVEGAYGPEVAALFPLYLGVPQPRFPVAKLYPPATDKQHVEIRMLRLLNRSREQAGLRPLIPSAALAAVARAHSQDMAQSGFFGHVSPSHGDLSQRLAGADLDYARASENLALSTEHQMAHDSLLESPSHRRTMLDPRLTHVGIGVAADPARGLVYVTQCFAGELRPADP